MVQRKTGMTIRKTHRYLGLFLGIQFMMWTISGLYFSWTDIDEIHGDQFRKKVIPIVHQNLLSLDSISTTFGVSSLALRTIANNPYYWINDSVLIDARSGIIKNKISEAEALKVASAYMIEDLEVLSIDLLTKTGKHHEYRGRPLPVYVINYDHPENVKTYINAKDGSFQRVRHQSWRWFDFLWMTHTMDYDGRDDFNTIVLRAFSLLGLITVLSGFVLWYVSSSTVRKIFRKR